MRKILVAIDNADGSWKAVDYVGRQFEGLKDLKITLFHVLEGLPPQFWDDGHLLTEEEKGARKIVIDKWLSNQRYSLEPLFKRAIEKLTELGIQRDQLETKSISESIEVIPQCILAEARAGGYKTLVIGRCGNSMKHLLLGSTASTIINAGAGIAICVVE